MAFEGEILSKYYHFLPRVVAERERKSQHYSLGSLAARTAQVPLNPLDKQPAMQTLSFKIQEPQADPCIEVKTI